MLAAAPPLASLEEPIVTWVTIKAVTAIAKPIGTAKARDRERVAGTRTSDSCSDGVGVPVARAATQPPSRPDGRQLPVDVDDAADDERHGRAGGTRRQHVPAPEGGTDGTDGPDEQDRRDDAAVGADGEHCVGIQPDHRVDRPARRRECPGAVPVTTEDPQAHAEADQANV